MWKDENSCSLGTKGRPRLAATKKRVLVTRKIQGKIFLPRENNFINYQVRTPRVILDP